MRCKPSRIFCRVDTEPGYISLLTPNRPVDDWAKLPGDHAAVGAMLDRLLHHGHVIKCGPRSFRTRIGAQDLHEPADSK